MIHTNPADYNSLYAHIEPVQTPCPPSPPGCHRLARCREWPPYHVKPWWKTYRQVPICTRGAISVDQAVSNEQNSKRNTQTATIWNIFKVIKVVVPVRYAFKTKLGNTLSALVSDALGIIGIDWRRAIMNYGALPQEALPYAITMRWIKICSDLMSNQTVFDGVQYEDVQSPPKNGPKKRKRILQPPKTSKKCKKRKTVAHLHTTTYLAWSFMEATRATPFLRVPSTTLMLLLLLLRSPSSWGLFRRSDKESKFTE